MSEKDDKGKGDLKDKVVKCLPWVKAEDLDLETLEYKPTKRQEAFREVAISSAEIGRYFKREWIEDARRDDYLKKKPVRLSEWKKWVQNPAFVVWFYDEFPDAMTPDEHEMKMMDGEFWKGIKNGLQSNREWAHKLYAKMRWGEAGVRTKRSEDIELRKFLGGETEANKWHPDPAEA